MPIEDIKKILTHAHDHDLSSQLLNKSQSQYRK